METNCLNCPNCEKVYAPRFEAWVYSCKLADNLWLLAVSEEIEVSEIKTRSFCPLLRNCQTCEHSTQYKNAENIPAIYCNLMQGICGYTIKDPTKRFGNINCPLEK